jgi:glucose-6-phosphate 1-epimerase
MMSAESNSCVQAVYSVGLHGEQLRTHLRVINTDDKPFEFTAALHSYFEVLDIRKARVLGLKGELDRCADRGEEGDTGQEGAEAEVMNTAA